MNAIILNDYLNNQEISEKDASLALTFTTLNSPLFLINYLNIIFKNKFITFKIILINYLLNVIIFLIISKKITNKSLNFKYKDVSILESINSAINNTINTSLKIFAITILFTIIISSLMFSNSIVTPLFKGLIEITQGFNSINIMQLSPKIKELYILIILSFSSLSIHMQIGNILSKYNINYKYFYVSRLVLIILSIIIFLLW